MFSTNHDFGGRIVALLLGVMLVQASCDNHSPGGADPDAAIGQDAAAQPDAVAQQDTAVALDAAPVDAGGDPDSAVIEDGSTPDTGTLDAGPVGMTVSLSTVTTFFLNCGLPTPPDPLHVNFDLTYDNTAGTTPANATIVSSRMNLQGACNVIWSFTVAPLSVGPVGAGASLPQSHTKVANSGTGSAPLCSCCGSSSTGVLELTIDIDGQQVQLTSAAMSFLCAM